MPLLLFLTITVPSYALPSMGDMLRAQECIPTLQKFHLVIFPGPVPYGWNEKTFLGMTEFLQTHSLVVGPALSNLKMPEQGILHAEWSRVSDT